MWKIKGIFGIIFKSLIVYTIRKKENMDKLSKEEVLHVARLARLELTEEEIEKYRVDLKTLFDEIEKILDVEESTNDLLISPWKNECSLRDKNFTYEIPKSLILNNAPDVYQDYIEVRGVFDE